MPSFSPAITSQLLSPTLSYSVQTNDHTHKTLSNLMQVLSDLCNATYPRPSAAAAAAAGIDTPALTTTKGGKLPPHAFGRDVLGPAFLDRVVCFLVASGPLPAQLKRTASATLLDLVTQSKANQELLCGGGCPGAPALFADFLSVCGDYLSQVDVLEVMFRCECSERCILL